MATTPTGSTASLVERVKNILFQPSAEWPRIDAEPTSIADIYKGYVCILAAIGPIAGLIGQQAFGYKLLGITYKPSLTSSIATAVITYVMSLVMIYVLALIIDALAPTFGGTKDKVKAFKAAAYSWTAAWVAGIFAIIPQLAMLAIVGLYSLYLLYLGIPVLMKAPQEKAVGYVAVTVVAAIVLYLVVGIVVGTLVAAVAPVSPLGGGGQITLPG